MGTGAPGGLIPARPPVWLWASRYVSIVAACNPTTCSWTNDTKRSMTIKSGGRVLPGRNILIYWMHTEASKNNKKKRGQNWWAYLYLRSGKMKTRKERSRNVESSWNVMAHGNAREGKWRGNWRMEWVASTLHTTSEHGVSGIITADTHTSAASSRLYWRPRRFKWTRPFRRKTKSGFCACAITFQTQSTYTEMTRSYMSNDTWG